MVQLLWRWVVHGAMVLWLGVAMPLLCVPGVSSDHDHGSHLVFADSSLEHSHDHGGRSHSAVGGDWHFEGLGYDSDIPGWELAAVFLSAVGLAPSLVKVRAPGAVIGVVLFEGLVHSDLFFPRPWRPPQVVSFLLRQDVS